MDSDPPYAQLDNSCVILITEQLLFRKKVHCRLGDSERIREGCMEALEHKVGFVGLQVGRRKKKILYTGRASSTEALRGERVWHFL